MPQWLRLSSSQAQARLRRRRRRRLSALPRTAACVHLLLLVDTTVGHGKIFHPGGCSGGTSNNYSNPGPQDPRDQGDDWPCECRPPHFRVLKKQIAALRGQHSKLTGCLMPRCLMPRGQMPRGQKTVFCLFVWWPPADAWTLDDPELLLNGYYHAPNKLYSQCSAAPGYGTPCPPGGMFKRTTPTYATINASTEGPSSPGTFRVSLYAACTLNAIHHSRVSLSPR